MKCRTCGTTLSAGALLCGECGTSAIAPRPTLGDTAHHDRRALLAAIAAEQRPASPTSPADPPRSVPGAAPAHAAQASHAAHAAAPDSPPATSLPRPDGPAHAAAAESRRPRSSALYSLVFSTGESIRVSGGGLVGRNPVAGPGEQPEYLVQIVDPARSVSKTHLEFGVDDEGFWIADRGSSNGTRLEPGTAAPVELVPGARTRVPRGSRVGLGDQHFDLH
ncbi:FHA domain-containing protein [Herbiconiux sp. YIM B11900]|uniref:FHA domain-containing protein n=1 Tax=Herbiconiux sp. YIM B11900 TaxID=3404131 RepID=UPI003F87FE5C